jgi:hypothetical protein
MKKTLLVLLSVFIISPICNSIDANQVYLTLINEVSFTSIPRDIVLFDNAYVITDDALVAVTKSDPYNVFKTEFTELSGAKSIAFIGHYCYAAISNYIAVYDFSKSPILKKATININGNVKKITISNGYLYVLNDDAGLQIYDVNIADFPVFKNTQITPFNASGLFVDNYRAYITSSGGHLSIIDVGDISKLPIIGTYSSGSKFYEPFVDGTLAYVPQGSTGVQVLDITKPANPEWQYNLYARKDAHQVITSNFYVWVADDKSVEGFFNSGPKSYYFAGNYKFDEKITRMALIDGKYMYVCSTDKTLKILRIDYKY